VVGCKNVSLTRQRLLLALKNKKKKKKKNHPTAWFDPYSMELGSFIENPPLLIRLFIGLKGLIGWLIGWSNDGCGPEECSEVRMFGSKNWRSHHITSYRLSSR
jgi:hypothetical protein